MYITINSTTTTTILDASNFGLSSAIHTKSSTNITKVNKLTITNASSSDATVSVLLDHLTSNADKDHYYITGTVTIPAHVTLVLDDPFSVNLKTHKLVLTNTGTNPKLTVRID